MASTFQSRYVPKRLRRPVTGRKDGRINFHETEDVSAAVLSQIIQGGFGEGIETPDSVVSALGSPDATVLEDSSLSTTEFPNANRDEPVILHITGLGYTTASAGNIFGLGASSVGVAVWFNQGRVNAVVKDANFRAAASLVLPEAAGGGDDLFVQIEVAPFRIAVGHQIDATGNIRWGAARQANGGAQYAADGAAGYFFGAFANAVEGSTTAPSIGGVATDIRVHRNQSIFS